MRREEKTEYIARSEAIRVYSGSDFSEKLSYAEIFPKGYFKYSDNEGFYGEADRLLISEKVKEGKTLRDSSMTFELSKTNSASKQSKFGGEDSG